MNLKIKSTSVIMIITKKNNKNFNKNFNKIVRIPKTIILNIYRHFTNNVQNTFNNYVFLKSNLSLLQKLCLYRHFANNVQNDKSNKSSKTSKSNSKLKRIYDEMRTIIYNIFTSKSFIIIITIFCIFLISIFLMGLLGTDTISFNKIVADTCTTIFKKRFPPHFGTPWSFKPEQLFWVFGSKQTTESILRNLDVLCLQIWHMSYQPDLALYIQAIVFLYASIWTSGWHIWCCSYGIGIGKYIINLIFLKVVLQMPIILEVTRFLAKSNSEVSLSQIKECILYSFRDTQLWSKILTCYADSAERMKILEHSTTILQPYLTGQPLDLTSNLDHLINVIPHVIIITLFRGTSLFPDYIFVFKLVPPDYTFLDIPQWNYYLFNCYNLFC